MKRELSISYDIFEWSELNEEDRELIEQAKQASQNSYAPYSKFHVGCALRLENKLIVTGNNQENASYPCGTCAERTTLFYAHANYPQMRIEEMAIAAETKGSFTGSPLPPCGLCRQALLEVETSQQSPIRLLMFGDKHTLVVSSIRLLLPFQFDAQMLDADT